MAAKTSPSSSFNMMTLLVSAASASADFDYNAIADAFLTTPTVSHEFDNNVEGKLKFWETSDCVRILAEDSPMGPGHSPFSTSNGCYLNNPNAPYGLFMFPPHEDEVVDEFTFYPVRDGNLSGTWHMLPDDVIVLVGQTPPACRYFSFSNYLYSRFADWEPATERLGSDTCPSGTSRCEIFASVADSINPDRGLHLDAEIFNTSFALVLGASVAGVEQARQGLMEAGVDPSVISNFSFPGTELKMGIEGDDDTLCTVMRNAFSEDPQAAAEYYTTPPFRVMRLRYSGGDEAIFDRVPLVDRSTGATDATLAAISLEEMEQAVEYLAERVVETLTAGSTLDNWTLQVTQTVNGVPDNGFECVDSATMCQGDCRDTLYPFSTAVYVRSVLCETTLPCDGVMDGLLTEDDEDVLVVVGVNHAKSNMSAYASISIYDAVYFWGVVTVGNDQLLNTADSFVSPDAPPYVQAALPYLYAYEVRRSCPPQSTHCVEVPTEQSTNTTVGQPFIPLANAVVITERMYNNPMTHVGPSPDEVLLPLTIHLRPKAAPGSAEAQKFRKAG